MKEVDKQGAQTMALVWLSGLAVLHKSACLVLFNTVCALLHCSCNQAYSKSFVDKAIAPEIVWFQARLPYISQKVNAPLSQGEKVWKVNVILTNCSLRWDYTGCQELWEHSGKRKLLEQQPSNMPSNVFFFFRSPHQGPCSANSCCSEFYFFGSDTLPFSRPHQ